MDLELTEEQQQLQNAAIEFARSELNDDMIRRDRDEVFSFEGWKKCARFGTLGLPVPPEYGGMGLGITDVIAVMEGRGWATVRGTRDCCFPSMLICGLIRFPSSFTARKISGESTFLDCAVVS